MILGGVLQCFGNFGATFSEAFLPQKREKDPDAFFDLTTAKKSIKVGFRNYSFVWYYYYIFYVSMNKRESLSVKQD